jgi:hypothetical protein
MTDPELLDRDWSHYPSTVLTFAGEREICVDLRLPLSEHQLGELAEAGPGSPFAVITAHDPRGLDLDEAENERRAARLKESVRSLGAIFIQVNACSPDGEHCEPGVAVKLSLTAAGQLAREYGQVAFFWFDGERFWIAGGVAEMEPIALPHSP